MAEREGLLPFKLIEDETGESYNQKEWKREIDRRTLS